MPQIELVTEEERQLIYDTMKADKELDKEQLKMAALVLIEEANKYLDSVKLSRKEEQSDPYFGVQYWFNAVQVNLTNLTRLHPYIKAALIAAGTAHKNKYDEGDDSE